jgi:hypothetical protein
MSIYLLWPREFTSQLAATPATPATPAAAGEACGARRDTKG